MVRRRHLQKMTAFRQRHRQLAILYQASEITLAFHTVAAVAVAVAVTVT